MKNIKNKIRIFTVLCVTIGWWGLLYPELSITPDTVIVVNETDNEKTDRENLYLDLLKAGRSQIRFRSKLLTELNAFWETKSWVKSTKN